MEKCPGRLSTEGVCEGVKRSGLVRRDEHFTVTQTEYVLEIEVFILQRAEEVIISLGGNMGK